VEVQCPVESRLCPRSKLDANLKFQPNTAHRFIADACGSLPPLQATLRPAE
jgi:hypothetical protein